MGPNGQNIKPDLGSGVSAVAMPRPVSSRLFLALPLLCELQALRVLLLKRRFRGVYERRNSVRKVSRVLSPSSCRLRRSLNSPSAEAAR
jgi:hypothetical protein